MSKFRGLEQTAAKRGRISLVYLMPTWEVIGVKQMPLWRVSLRLPAETRFPMLRSKIHSLYTLSVQSDTLSLPVALCFFTSQTPLIYWTNWKRRWFPGEEGREWIPSWPLQLLILCCETWNLITLIISLAHIATNVISSHKIIKALLKSIFKECVTCISRSEILISNTLTQTSETKCWAKQQWQGLRSTNEEWCHCLRETLHIINTLAH